MQGWLNGWELSIFESNISKGTAFFLQGLTDNDSKAKTRYNIK